MPPNDTDHAAALQGAALAFLKQPKATTPEPDESLALIAAIREFETKQRQIGHRQDYSESEDHDSDAIGDGTVSRRSASIDRQAGIVGDRIRQLSLRAADLAVGREEQRLSNSLRRPRQDSDTQYIAAKLATEREKIARPASADLTGQPFVTRSGVTIIPSGRRRDGSVHSRTSEAYSGSSSIRHESDSLNGRQSRRNQQQAAHDDLALIRKANIPTRPSSNSLITLYDRRDSSASTSSKERIVPPVRPRRLSLQHHLRTSRPAARRKPADLAPSLSKDTSSDKGVIKPAQLNKEVSSDSFKTVNDSLQGAVAASNLAEARAREAPPRPPPPRRSGYTDRAPSPPKFALRQTLRREQTYDVDELKRLKRYRKHHLINKHPHKHSEGNKKRWRDTITERERKRYEGVWAANQGLWIVTDSDEKRIVPSKAILRALPKNVAPGTMVLNTVVHDIWSRSRLSQDMLASIWDLVSHTALGMLSREEFVVGMWLIDQCLKGRKLPVKVSQSVWASTQTLCHFKMKPAGR